MSVVFGSARNILEIKAVSCLIFVSRSKYILPSLSSCQRMANKHEHGLAQTRSQKHARTHTKEDLVHTRKWTLPLGPVRRTHEDLMAPQTLDPRSAHYLCRILLPSTCTCEGLAVVSLSEFCPVRARTNGRVHRNTPDSCS
jgi:hypothetical protein